MSSVIATPVVDLAIATRESKSKLHTLRKTQAVRAGNAAVVEKHASRTPLRRSTQTKSAKLVPKQQLGFNF
jgi:deoxyribodipyrimidine photo-lyase